MLILNDIVQVPTTTNPIMKQAIPTLLHPSQTIGSVTIPPIYLIQLPEGTLEWMGDCGKIEEGTSLERIKSDGEFEHVVVFEDGVKVFVDGVKEMVEMEEEE